MNLEEYLRESGMAGSDHFGLHRFARQLLRARRDVEVLIGLLDQLDTVPRGQVVPSQLGAARDAAADVAAFFAPEFHMGRRAYALHADLVHALTQACAFPAGLDLALTAPRAASRARRLAHYLNSHSATELACNFGRARTLLYNSPFLVLFTGGIAGVAMYFMTALLISTPWLDIGLGLATGAGTAVTVGSLITGMLRGEPAVVPWPLVAVALRIIPARHRLTYAQEFRAELYELSILRQLLYAVNVALRAPDLRRSLTAQRPAERNGSART